MCSTGVPAAFAVIQVVPVNLSGFLILIPAASDFMPGASGIIHSVVSSYLSGMDQLPVMVTGANGFLGHSLCAQLLDKGIPVIATGTGDCRLPYAGHPLLQYASFDIQDATMAHSLVSRHRPGLIIHAAALCKPDECELQPEKAHRINVEGTRYLLEAAGKQGCRFLYVSTDFIFRGDKGMYTEEDTPDPVNYYGQTKWEAEQLVQQYTGPFAIARTVLVYGKPPAGKSNILTIVKEKLEKGEGYKVVSDQVRTPTYAEDLARGMALMIEKKATGIYHLSGEEVMTPYDMACRVADYFGYDQSLLTNVTAATFSQPARRPLKTGFLITKAKRELGYAPVSFAEGLQKTFA